LNSSPKPVDKAGGKPFGSPVPTIMRLGKNGEYTTVTPLGPRSYKVSRRVILVHGFGSVFSGKYDIDRLRPFFEAEGYEVVEFNYGFRLFTTVRNPKWAKKLYEMTQPGDAVVGFSNGCGVAQLASLPDEETGRPGAPFSQIVFLAPALDVNVEIGPQVNLIHVWHTATDEATFIGQFIPGSQFGPMGNHGYLGKDPRFINYDRASYVYRIRSFTHLDVLLVDSKRNYFGPIIARRVRECEGVRLTESQL